jgi:hypothetical protein
MSLQNEHSISRKCCNAKAHSMYFLHITQGLNLPPINTIILIGYNLKMKKFIKKRLKLNKLFKSEDSRFILANSLKISSVYLLTSLFAVYAIWLVLSLNNIFFEANGFLGIEDLKSVYFDFIAAKIMHNVAYVFVFNIILFFAGIYLTKILLRPFEIIGEYCSNAIENKHEVYNPDTFSDYKLLTRFSEFFFQYILEARKNKKLIPNTIPPIFSKIHGPVFDRVFFFHFALFISIITLVSSIFLVVITTDSYDSMVELALKAIPNAGSNVAYFLKNQKFIFESVQIYSITILILSYFFLAFHLYTKVSGPVFGFFSTMRSFLKGNYSARVHLVGYPHIRPFSRAFNKFLDAICRELDVEESIEK